MMQNTLLRFFLFVAIATSLSACGGSSNATNVDTDDINIAPVANAVTVEAREDNSIEAKLSANDEDGDALTFIIVTQPMNGAVVIEEDTATYTPVANFNGSDSFTYKANDGTSDSETVSVILNVAAVNDAPVAMMVSTTTSENIAVEVTLSATDADGDSLIYVIVAQPTSGVLGKVNGNKVIYTPMVNYNGSDSFTYKANDGIDDSNIGTVTITIETSPTPTTPGKLNDTGITQCSDSNTNELSCPVTDYPNQDAQYGRDVDVNDDSDGHAGFSFAKLDADGKELLANATDWSCVRDNVTGLIWEVKQGGNGTVGDEGLHDADDLYNWYTTDTSNDGGSAGYQDDDGAICYGYSAGSTLSHCNTQAYVDRVNTQGLCGSSDWRLPAREELRSIVSYDRFNAAIDTTYFPNTNSDFWYWSSSPDAHDSSKAWVIGFANGYGDARTKDSFGFVRLVRGG